MLACGCTLAGTAACITCPNAQGHYMTFLGNYPPPYRTVPPQHAIDYEKLAAELLQQVAKGK